MDSVNVDRRITKKCTGAAKSGRIVMENHLSPPGDFGRYPTKDESHHVGTCNGEKSPEEDEGGTR